MQALVHCCSRVCAGSAQLFCSPKRACLFLCLWPPRPFPGRVHQQVHSRPSGAWRDRCNEKDGHATDEGRRRGGVAPGMWGSCAAPNAPLFRPPDLCSVLFELYSLHHSGLLQAVNCEQATTTQAQGIYGCLLSTGCRYSAAELLLHCTSRRALSSLPALPACAPAPSLSARGLPQPSLQRQRQKGATSSAAMAWG